MQKKTNCTGSICSSDNLNADATVDQKKIADTAKR